LVELLRRIAPELVSDVMFELSYSQEPRGLTEILEAEDRLMHQVWYNRHWGRRVAIEEGRTQLVEKATYPIPLGGPDVIQRDIWEGALKAHESVERR
jgi:hypothetical protein